MQAEPSSITNIFVCTNLLMHETTRVLHDRLVSDEDRLFFYQELCEEINTSFKVKYDAEQLHNKPIIFGDFQDLNALSGDRVYRQVNNTKLLTKMLEVIYLS